MIRNYLGLDLTPTELRAVALRRRHGGPAITGGRILPLSDGVLKPSLQKGNVRDGAALQKAIREALIPLAGRENRVALSLPLGSGQVLLTETEAPFKNRREGEEILRWQLKTQIPVDSRDIRLDYRELRRTETGQIQIAVGWLPESVLEEYEELLEKAGFGAAEIDFHPLLVSSYYQSHIDLGDEFVLLGLDGDGFWLQVVQAGVPAFFRFRMMPPHSAGLYQELSRTLANGWDRYPGLRRGTIYLHCASDAWEPLPEVLLTVFGRDPVLLDPHLERLSSGRIDVTSVQARGLVAALGAAERMM